MSLNPSNSISERITGKQPFTNVAGVGKREPERVDSILTAELRTAGIDVIEMVERYGEPQSVIAGELRGWKFRRAWYYWMADGPGIPFEAATKLHEAHGKSVRVEGHCGCPSPAEFTGVGNPVTSYHVDNQDGLNALADAIRALSPEVPVPLNVLKVAQSALQERITRMRKDLSETPGHQDGAARIVGKMIQDDMDAFTLIEKALTTSTVLPKN